MTAAIVTERLGKQYVLGVTGYGYDTLRESLLAASRRLTTRSRSPRERETIWALRDVTLSVAQGDVVGLIGHNGAGKSTFLKILSRITDPTSGYADVTGRVGSLLEVGTGFHPELTGRENIYLNGSIIGMRRAEIRRRFEEIVEFAEIGRFLDTPVKRYSSGMSVRLAFAVAAHLEPEILLVDEVLAVGDAAFQRKSLGKMGQVAEEGRTVIFVSHNLALIRALCRRGVLLERGNVVSDGSAAETLDIYLRSLEESASADLLERRDRDSRGWDESHIARVDVTPTDGSSVVLAGAPVTIAVEVTEVLPELHCAVTIVDALGHPVVSFDSQVASEDDVRDHDLGTRLECEVPSLPLLPGRYRLDVLLRGRQRIQDGLQAARFFDVEPGLVGGRPVPPASEGTGDVALAHRWRLPR